MTKLIFAGSGSAFTIDNFQSNMIIEKDGFRLLIDCGSDIRRALHNLDLTYRDIDTVYISHLHGDHTGGLEWLGFCTYFDPNCEKPTVYISSFLKSDLWNHVLSGGMSSLEGTVNDMSDYFDVRPVPKNRSFGWMGINFTLVQTIHYMYGYIIIPSFGLLFEIDGKTIFITTDTQFCPEQIKKFYDRADLILHDCETSPFESGVHAHYNHLKTLPKETKKKIWLYHYQDGELPDAKYDGFKGFAKIKQVIKL